ncbi:protein phosphatase 1 regulatory subunit 42 isoform X1 [Bemisia tabaci]
MYSFEEFHNLRKLYLGYNCISVVEGLENCSKLEVLHIQNQRLPPGGMMYFDPRCVTGIQICLKDLNVAGNNLIVLTDFVGLNKLEKLDATDNKLENLSQIRDDLSELSRLRSLDLRGNPITKEIRYREKIVAVLQCVDDLDGKTVTDMNRIFIQNLEKCKKAEKKPAIEFSKDIKSLAEHLPPGIRNSITEPEAKKGIASRINVMLPNTPPVQMDMMPGFPKRKMLKKQSSSSQQKDSLSKVSSKSNMSKSSEEENRIDYVTKAPSE